MRHRCFEAVRARARDSEGMSEQSASGWGHSDHYLVARKAHIFWMHSNGYLIQKLEHFIEAATCTQRNKYGFVLAQPALGRMLLCASSLTCDQCKRLLWNHTRPNSLMAVPDAGESSTMELRTIGLSEPSNLAGRESNNVHYATDCQQHKSRWPLTQDQFDVMNIVLPDKTIQLTETTRTGTTTHP